MAMVGRNAPNLKSIKPLCQPPGRTGSDPASVRASCSQGGIYVFTWLDTYTAGLALLCSALFEALAVGWVYGSHVLAGDIQQMTGQRPALFWRCCWKFISPLFLGVSGRRHGRGRCRRSQVIPVGRESNRWCCRAIVFYS